MCFAFLLSESRVECFYPDVVVFDADKAVAARSSDVNYEAGLVVE